jgi:hypothetical protein
VKLLFGFVVMIVLLDLHCILWRTVYFTATRSLLGCPKYQLFTQQQSQQINH